MVGSGSHQVESIGSQHENPFLNLERRRDREGSVHTVQFGKSQPRDKSHLSCEENTRALQLEVDHLKRKLRCAQRNRTSSSYDVSSNGREDTSYRRRSRTPPIESFSYEEEYHHKRRYKSPPHKGLGNDTMSKALKQISKSPFTHKIEGAKLPR